MNESESESKIKWFAQVNQNESIRSEPWLSLWLRRLNFIVNLYFSRKVYVLKLSVEIFFRWPWFDIKKFSTSNVFPKFKQQARRNANSRILFIYLEVYVTNFSHAENQSSKSKPQFVKFYVSQDKYQYCKFRIGKIAELKVQIGWSKIFF